MVFLKPTSNWGGGHLLWKWILQSERFRGRNPYAKFTDTYPIWILIVGRCSYHKWSIFTDIQCYPPKRSAPQQVRPSVSTFYRVPSDLIATILTMKPRSKDPANVPWNISSLILAHEPSTVGAIKRGYPWSSMTVRSHGIHGLWSSHKHEWGFQTKWLCQRFFPECVARVPVSLWGSGGWECVRSTLRPRPQPFATVRNRPQPSATVRTNSVWPCLWEVLQRWSFLEVSDVSLLRFAWQAWHFVTFRCVLQRVENRFAWQAQYFCDVFRRCVAVFVAGAALWTCPSSFFVAGAAL